jgi:hypothetical protein
METPVEMMSEEIGLPHHVINAYIAAKRSLAQNKH